MENDRGVSVSAASVAVNRPSRTKVKIPRASVGKRPSSAPPKSMLAMEDSSEEEEDIVAEILDSSEDEAVVVVGETGPTAGRASPGKKLPLAPAPHPAQAAVVGGSSSLLEAIREATAPSSYAGLLDMRPTEDFLAAHFPRSVSVPAVTQDRLGELPNRFRRFGVVVPAASHAAAAAAAADEQVVAYDPQTVSNLDFLALHRYYPRPIIVVPSLPNSSEWTAFWSQIPSDLKESGHSTHTLFSPSPGLERNIARIESSLAASFPGETWKAIDLGSGAGRDALFLLSRGLDFPDTTIFNPTTSSTRPPNLWSLTGIDHLPRALKKATLLIQRHLSIPLQQNSPTSQTNWNLSERWHPIHAELKRDGRVRLWPAPDLGHSFVPEPPNKQPFWESQYHLVTASRFLPPRAFWPTLENMVRPNGGFFLICTFLEGTYHPVHPDNFLYRGELRRFLEPRGWEVEVEEEETTEEGKLVVVFLARRGKVVEGEEGK